MNTTTAMVLGWRARQDEKEALAILRRSGPMRASEFGHAMWGRYSPGLIPRHFGPRGGKLLVLLESRGVVERENRGDGTYWKARPQ